MLGSATRPWTEVHGYPQFSLRETASTLWRVKSSYLLSLLESVPEVAAGLKDAHTKDRKFEDVVKSVEQATVLVLVY